MKEYQKPKIEEEQIELVDVISSSTDGGDEDSFNFFWNEEEE